MHDLARGRSPASIGFAAVHSLAKLRQGTPEALPYPILQRLSRPRGAALRLAPGHLCMLLLKSGVYAGLATMRKLSLSSFLTLIVPEAAE